MTMLNQRTLRNEIRATGIGIHTGEKIFMALKPAPANTGIVFRRIDVSPALDISALATHVGDTSLSTSLVQHDVKISTVEHLLSAFSGVGYRQCDCGTERA